MESKIDIQNLHQTFWKCRDFELSNLWQRSVFLTAFLVLCFTAYGAILMKIFEDQSLKIESLIGLHFVENVLSIIGLIFSIFWIKMAKASKAWYEVYESAISAIESNREYAEENVTKIGGFKHYRLPNYGGVNMNNSLFSTKAGEYSVSKINIGIGQVFMILWLMIGIIHIVLIGTILSNHFYSKFIVSISILIFVVILLIVLWVFIYSKFLKSSSLEKYKEGNKICSEDK